jgi:diguanylate cyclase (GGDEF)-like protein
MNNPNTGVILIVDDNHTNLAVLSKVLKSAGLKVRVAIDGESAIAQVEYAPPELILLDVKMPGIDGFETCQKLKANPVARDIPIIFMTALADTEHKIKGLSLGAVDYITKPFQEEEVLARIRVHLKLHFLTRKVIEQSAALQQANQQLMLLANLDGLTEVANRRRFDEYLEQQWQLLAQKQAPITLILCDLDYFKSYNDFYGHQAGDDCLKQVASALGLAARRSEDLVCRYGGEEFALILPNTDFQGAIKVAEITIAEVKKLQIPHAQSLVSPYVTISLGISCQIPSQDFKPKSAIAAADAALYQAKQQGRDRFYLDQLCSQVKISEK